MAIGGYRERWGIGSGSSVLGQVAALGDDALRQLPCPSASLRMTKSFLGFDFLANSVTILVK